MPKYIITNNWNEEWTEVHDNAESAEAAAKAMADELVADSYHDDTIEVIIYKAEVYKVGRTVPRYFRFVETDNIACPTEYRDGAGMKVAAIGDPNTKLVKTDSRGRVIIDNSDNCYACSGENWVCGNCGNVS